MEKIKIEKQYLSSVTQDRLRDNICVSNRVINFNRINKSATLRACFSAVCERLQRVRWNFQNKFLIIKARRYRHQGVTMAEELKSIIMLESMAEMSRSKDDEDIEILKDEP